MEADDHLIFISGMILVFSLIAFSVVLTDAVRFNALITGNVIEFAYVNISVDSVVALNFTNDSVNFGAGAVLGSNATVDTLGNVVDGNWTNTTNRFVIRNVGNENLTINLSSGKTASGFIGGSSPSYQYNVSDLGLSVCDPPSSFSLDTFYEVNASPDYRHICQTFEPGQEITIDLRLIIPNNSNIGVLSDSLTITYESA